MGLDYAHEEGRKFKHAAKLIDPREHRARIVKLNLDLEIAVAEELTDEQQLFEIRLGHMARGMWDELEVGALVEFNSIGGEARGARLAQEVA